MTGKKNKNSNEKITKLQLTYGVLIPLNGGSPSEISTYTPVGYAASMADGWGSAAGLFEEFRVKRLRIVLNPFLDSGGTSGSYQIPPPLYVAFDEKNIASSSKGIPNILQFKDKLIVPSGLLTNMGTVSRSFSFSGTRGGNSLFPSNWTSTSTPTVHPGTIFLTSEACGVNGATSHPYVMLVILDLEFRTLGN
jgi:hypothetical protein